MTDAICLEIALQKDYLGTRVLDSVYFGGGTPSLMGKTYFNKIMNSLKAYFSLADVCEITLEANPEDLSHQQLATYREAGINRLSIGVQSFSDNVLAFLNRSHDSRVARQSIERARFAGFDHLSFDLMYSIPHQDSPSWISTINTALSYRPEHLSAYSLTIENKTVFGHWLLNGRMTPLEESESVEQFELLVSLLEKAGYVHYEVSNFCLPGFHAIHNSRYWTREPYLGIGPSAHSFDGHSRQFNIKNNSLYIKALRHNKVPYEREVLSREESINEYIFTSLRTMWGCDFEYLRNQYDIDMEQLYGDYLLGLEAKNLVSMRKNCLLLTPKGKLLADKIASDLFV